MDTRSLSIHGPYRCRHRGACCTAGWPIPVEADRLFRLRASLASGTLRMPPGHDRRSPFVSDPRPPADRRADTLLGTAASRCVFYDAGATRCAVHHTLGHDALPLACRQFPRVSVVDPRGVSVTLSHFCPTAAALLDGASGIHIVLDARAFPSDGEYEGLDARGALPPLLGPDLLMDWESWWEWERLSVALIGREPLSLALARLQTSVEHVRTWRPNGERLIDRVRGAFDRALDAAPAGWRPTAGNLAARRAEVLAAIPQALRPAPPAPVRAAGPPRSLSGPGGTAARAALTALTAAHAFANWTAHLGGGLRTWLRSVEAPAALVATGLDVRTADLWLRHLADPRALADRWSAVESPATPPP